MAYEIKVNLIPGLPKEPYDGGVGAYVGVIGHSTANYGDSDNMERNYEAGHFNDAFVHFFVDDTGIMQTADTDYICYGAGHTANHKGYVQVELCQTHDHAKFLTAFDMYCYILAYNLYKKKLGVVDNVTLRSHKQISDSYKETDHQDPIAYLAEHGKTWADVVSGAKAKYDEMAAADKPKVVPAPAPVADVYFRLYVDGKQVGAYKVGANAMADGWKMYNAGQKTVILVTPDKSKYTFDLHQDQNPTKPAVPAPQPTLSPVAVPSPKPVGTALKGKSVATLNQLEQFMHGRNADAPMLAAIYFKMEGIYGIRADIAFCQMCKETDFQRFGGDVKKEQNNPAGLGATGGVAGASFKTVEDGIEAQFQHLYAYACTDVLPAGRPVVDGRFNLVKRGSASYAEILGINENPQKVGWATGANYGVDIINTYLAVALKCSDTVVIQKQSDVATKPQQAAPTAKPVEDVKVPSPTVEPVKTDPGASTPNTVNTPVAPVPVANVPVADTAKTATADDKGVRAFLQMLVKMITDFLNK